ncbi:hypothetical protein ColLi_08174 [Colletotrichum liriopes]|uniref:Uncharacterized protein n=1 Tax=Colletotrichum liriopes TaxID=708192 RepID=A0AA37GQF8_9PEZI|nr:hypothetical protein ColLi_08174 [Colletotrichum liriopes]
MFPRPPASLDHPADVFLASAIAALADLGNYQAVPGDAAVVAWPVSHTRPDVANHKRDIEFTVKARVLKRKEAAAEGDAEEKAAAAPSEPAKDEL